MNCPDGDEYTSSLSYDQLHTLSDTEEDEIDIENKPKKNVTFNDNVSKTIFRATSSILGRRQKNQKRARNRNRKNAKNQNSNNTQKDPNTTKTELDFREDCHRSRQDSGYDSEEPREELAPFEGTHINDTLTTGYLIEAIE